MLEYFRLVMHIEIFLVPIMAGLLSWAMINDKQSKRKFLIALVLSTGVLLLSFIGVYLNSPSDIRDSMKDNFAKSISLENLEE